MPKVTELFAFVIADKNEDDEGVPAFETRMGAMPLMGADFARADSLKPIAQRLATQMGKPIRLLRFTHLEEVETLFPKDADER